MTEKSVTSLDRQAETATLTLHGEVDVLNVDQVRMALTEAIAGAPRTIVVDLADLSFMLLAGKRTAHVGPAGEGIGLAFPASAAH